MTRIETPYGPGTITGLLRCGYYRVQLDQPAEIMLGHMTDIALLGPAAVETAPKNGAENRAENFAPDIVTENQLSLI